MLMKISKVMTELPHHVCNFYEIFRDRFDHVCQEKESTGRSRAQIHNNLFDQYLHIDVEF